MGEMVEKIYCCDRGDNDNALAAAILAGNNRRDDWGPMAAMMGGGMIFCRWTADAIGKAIKLDWEKFV